MILLQLCLGVCHDGLTPEAYEVFIAWGPFDPPDPPGMLFRVKRT